MLRATSSRPFQLSSSPFELVVLNLATWPSSWPARGSQGGPISHAISWLRDGCGPQLRRVKCVRVDLLIYYMCTWKGIPCFFFSRSKRETWLFLELSFPMWDVRAGSVQPSCSYERSLPRTKAAGQAWQSQRRKKPGSFKTLWNCRVYQSWPSLNSYF